MAGALDDLVAAAVRAWGGVARAWIEAANAVWVAWMDIPAVESGITGFNKEVVVLPAQPVSTSLEPGPFIDWGDHQLPPVALTVVPNQVSAGEVTEVTLLVQPPKGTVSGTYTGSLYDPSGACLLEGVGVYVVGDNPP